MGHKKYMEKALSEARKALVLGEVPVGAVIVKDGKIISVGHNLRETTNRVSAHAEIIALDKAAEYLGTWNMSDCTLYVTVEPCPMCAGAILQSQLKTVVYGTEEPNSGSLGTVFNLNEVDGFNHTVEIIGGIEKEACKTLMTGFFKKKRKERIDIKVVTDKNREGYMNVRKEVFVFEQNVPLNLEIDDYDIPNRADVIHIVALYKGIEVGATRLIKKNKTLKVGRVAVLSGYRHLKIGSKLMQWVDKHAVNNGFTRLELGAQLQAIPFYTKNGYREYGDPFVDAGIDHKMMRKDFIKPEMD